MLLDQGFEFTEADSDTGKCGTVMKQVTVGNKPFTLCHDVNEQCLQIYYGAAGDIPERESRRYAIEIDSQIGRFNSIVRFTRVQRFCSFPLVVLPCKVALRSLNAGVGDPDVPYTGIENMGVTCYIASSLQFLFSVVPFVNLVFASECDENSTGRELQKIFTKLLAGDQQCHLREFVGAFGNSQMALTTREQDAHEFILNLFDRLDHELGKDFEDLRNKIFGVTGVRVIECVNVDVKKETEEFLNEIQLPVQGMSGLYESLDSITAKEEIDEKWDTETKHGKQEAVRYLKYKKLPPFLIMDLGRYCYLPEKQRCDEVRDLFDCPDEIDMKKYCVDDYEGETKYVLASVIAHRGNPTTGHYIAFTQPRMDGKWFQFNDSSVSISSLNEVHRTYGKMENVFSKAIRFITGGRFLAYIVGYVRRDSINIFQAAPKVPVRISRFLSTVFTAKRICHNEIEGSNIYGFGKDLEWDNPDTTLGELFSDREDVAIFAAWPDVHDKLYGPFDPSTRASHLTVRGAQATFVGVPKDMATDPVFFVANREFLGIYNKNRIIDTFSKSYEFRVNGIPVQDFTNINNGSIVFGVPLTTVKIEIGKSEYEVKVDAPYEAIQTLVAKDRAPQVLFYTRNSGKPLKPRQFPTALQLHAMAPLDVRFLDGTATAGSLDLFQQVNIDLYDLGHKQTKKNSLWLRKDSTVAELTKQLPGWFGFKPDREYVYIVSPSMEQAITRIMKEDEVVKGANIRVDILKCHVPQSCKEIAQLFEDNAPFSALEVRTLSFEEGWPKFKTLGFHMITKASTGNSFLKLLSKGQQAKLTVRGAREIYKVYMIDGRDLLYRLVDQLATERDWANDRPVIVLQLTKKKEE